MKRRGVVTGALAGAAVALGAGTAVWRSSRPETNDSAPASRPSVDFWSRSFQRPEGGSVAMAAFRGRPLLVNFWATWCAPCITELPLLDAFAGRQGANGWHVLALAVDGVEPVQRFLSTRSLTLAVALAGDAGVDLPRQWGNAAGGLPFSVAFDSSGRIAAQHLGKVDALVLKRWANALS